MYPKTFFLLQLFIIFSYLHQTLRHFPNTGEQVISRSKKIYFVQIIFIFIFIFILNKSIIVIRTLYVEFQLK